MSNSIAITNDPILTQIFRGYAPQDQQFVYPSFLPTIPVTSLRGQVRTLGTKAQDFLRLHNDVTIGRGLTPEITVEMSKADLYNCDYHTLQVVITKKDGHDFSTTDWKAGQQEAARMFTRMLKTAVMMGREYALANAIFNAGVITQTSALGATAKWDVDSTSDPIGDALLAKKTVYDACGYVPNVAVMPMNVFFALQSNKQAKVTTANGGTIQKDPLSLVQCQMVLGVDKIIIGQVRRETAAKGQTSSLANVWGKSVLFAYVNPNPTPEQFEKSFGYSFVLQDPVIDQYYQEDPKDVLHIRYEEAYDDVILDATTAYLFTTVIS